MNTNFLTYICAYIIIHVRKSSIWFELSISYDLSLVMYVKWISDECPKVVSQHFPGPMPLVPFFRDENGLIFGNSIGRLPQNHAHSKWHCCCFAMKSPGKVTCTVTTSYVTTSWSPILQLNYKWYFLTIALIIFFCAINEVSPQI